MAFKNRFLEFTSAANLKTEELFSHLHKGKPKDRLLSGTIQAEIFEENRKKFGDSKSASGTSKLLNEILLNRLTNGKKETKPAEKLSKQKLLK